MNFYHLPKDDLVGKLNSSDLVVDKNVDFDDDPEVWLKDVII